MSEKKKCESFADCHTRWEGLWYHPEAHNYTSAVLNLAALKGFKGTCRLRMIKNRKKGDTQPTYLFTIGSTTEDMSDNVEPLEIRESQDNTQALLDELKNVLQESYLNGERLALPTESLATAKGLYNRAVEIIEELTGEKWEFNYVYYG